MLYLYQTWESWASKADKDTNLTTTVPPIGLKSLWTIELNYRSLKN